MKTLFIHIHFGAGVATNILDTQVPLSPTVKMVTLSITKSSRKYNLIV